MLGSASLRSLGLRECSGKGRQRVLPVCGHCKQIRRGIPSAAGRFGFQREMNALKTLKSGEQSEDSTNVTALLHSTHEIELRLQQVNRWFRLWNKDVRDGWVILGRFRVGFFRTLNTLNACCNQDLSSSESSSTSTAGSGHGGRMCATAGSFWQGSLIGVTALLRLTHQQQVDR